MDYPGFGLSDGLHGYIPSFDEMVDDVIEHYTNIKGVSLFVLLFHCCSSCCCCLMLLSYSLVADDFLL